MEAEIKALIERKENFPRTYDVELHREYLAIEAELDDLIFRYLRSSGVGSNEESYELIRKLIKEQNKEE
ncbi:hypothetical protein AB1282_00520 [Gottfriedia sp. S16(2024)]|uniref:hypothetical protein n=1 Tax=Gottfriedia sp. S16(2024) TaxID=3162883 RepID=UPI003D1C4317